VDENLEGICRDLFEGISPVSTVHDCRLEDQAIGVRFPAEARLFPLAPVSRPAMRPTQPPIQWVRRVISPAVKRGWGVTLTTHPI
jgi:hypothetical protein